MKRCLLTGHHNQAFFLLASWTLAASVHASYAQMRLDGVGLLLAFSLSVVYGVMVDLGLFLRIFRFRTAAVVGSVGAVAVVFLLLSQAGSPSERTGFFKGAPGGSELVMLVVTSAVFLPFIVIAPFAQYLAMHHGRRWPGWITGWIILQLALLPGFLVLAGTEEYFWRHEFSAGEAVGREARAGGLGGILERAEQRHERIWGTAWTYRQQKPPAGSYVRPSAWGYGLAKSIDATALMAASEPLSAPDRAALRTLIDRHFGSYALPHTRAKLLWDTLDPGSFSKQLAPNGANEVGAADEEVIPLLLDRLEKHAEARQCPGGQMMDADRAVLNALVLAKGRVWSVEKRAYEMRPQWDGYPQRVERLCRGPA